jgi:glycosyltransferase involved in cell wall biosynthesis
MIEAMACGTPVLAFAGGSVAEVVDEGITGHIVSSMAEAAVKIDSLLALDRAAIRRRFELRFTAARMASDYVRLYQRQVSQAHTRRPARGDRAGVDGASASSAL